MEVLKDLKAVNKKLQEQDDEIQILKCKLQVRQTEKMFEKYVKRAENDYSEKKDLPPGFAEIEGPTKK